MIGTLIPKIGIKGARLIHQIQILVSSAVNPKYIGTVALKIEAGVANIPLVARAMRVGFVWHKNGTKMTLSSS